MASEHPSCEFRIVAGTHRDATFRLGRDAVLIVGADESCDICLSDAGVEPRHAVLMSQGDAVSLRRLDGEIEVDGTPVAAGAPVVLGPGASIALGEARLQLAGVAPAVAPVSTPGTAIAPKARRRRVLTAVVAGGALVVAASLTTRNLAASRAAPASEPDAGAVRALLQREGLARQVQVAETSYGLVLTGVVERERATGLRSAVTTLHMPIVNSVLSEAELLDQVRDVFRTHGYEASVSYVGERRVRVENLDENHQRVREAAARVRSDVPQVQELNFAAASATPQPEHLPQYHRGRTEPVSARVDGDTAYLATTGGARYFVGSVLPGGETIRRITPTAVQIDRDGQIGWFGL